MKKEYKDVQDLLDAEYLAACESGIDDNAMLTEKVRASLVEISRRRILYGGHQVRDAARET